jgi:hypothetical protein
MSAPNNAYLYGTTPSTGGYAAMEQAIQSALLGVGTTIAAAVSATGYQAVTPGSMTNIGIGTAVWINWGLADQECVSINATTGSTFSATFTKTHTGGATVTCGLPTLSVSSPWTQVSTSIVHVEAIYVSTQTTSLGDCDYVPIILGGSSNPFYIGFATGDDIDVATGAANPRNACNWDSASGITSSTLIQDAAFSWWLCVCEFAICVVVDVSGSYSCFQAGTFRTPQPTSQRGVGIATTVINNGATSVTVAPDISSRIAVGQKVLIVNQSHSSTSTNWAAAPALMTVQTVVSGGSTATITFTAGTPNAFDTGALVGSVPQKYAGAGASIDTATIYMSRNLDGTWTNDTSQTANVDSNVITSQMESYESPTQNPNVMYAGEIDIPAYQTTSPYKGACGFYYCSQYFVGTGVNNQDAYGDPSNASVWKVFVGGTHGCGLGPFLNPLNTQASMTPITNTPFFP